MLTGHLADDHVVLVVSGDRDHEVGDADTRPLEDEELSRVTDDRSVLEVFFEVHEAHAVLLDDRHLVVMRRRARARFEPTLPPPATRTNI